MLGSWVRIPGGSQKQAKRQSKLLKFNEFREFLFLGKTSKNSRFQQEECANGKERKYQELNHYLETVRTKVLQIHRQLEQDGKPITAEILKRRYYGEGESPKMLLELFNDHNKRLQEL